MSCNTSRMSVRTTPILGSRKAAQTRAIVLDWRHTEIAQQRLQGPLEVEGTQSNDKREEG